MSVVLRAYNLCRLQKVPSADPRNASLIIYHSLELYSYAMYFRPGTTVQGRTSLPPRASPGFNVVA